jgi:amino acid transporter
MPKEGLLENIIEIFSSAVASRISSNVDKRLKDYLIGFIQNIVKRIMLMAAGIFIVVIGIIFLFATGALYLNEYLHSSWMGWGIAGIIILIFGLITYTLSRR